MRHRNILGLQGALNRVTGHSWIGCCEVRLGFIFQWGSDINDDIYTKLVDTVLPRVNAKIASTEGHEEISRL
jgi:hypothetical protein